MPLPSLECGGLGTDAADLELGVVEEATLVKVLEGYEAGVEDSDLSGYEAGCSGNEAKEDEGSEDNENQGRAWMQKVVKCKEEPQAPSEGEEMGEYPGACGAELCEEETTNQVGTHLGLGRGRRREVQLYPAALSKSWESVADKDRLLRGQSEALGELCFQLSVLERKLKRR